MADEYEATFNKGQYFWLILEFGETIPYVHKSGFFLASAAEKTKTQGQNSSKKLSLSEPP